jgi:tetratricopeptide (TPR) repeat protein
MLLSGRKRFRLCFSSLAALAALWMLHPDTVRAEVVETSYKTLYAELLQDPTNTELTLRYASLAWQAGDAEAALAPLERLLITFPNSANLMIQLADVYAQLGTNNLAIQLYTDALALGTAPLQQLEAAQAKLEELLTNQAEGQQP